MLINVLYTVCVKSIFILLGIEWSDKAITEGLCQTKNATVSFKKRFFVFLTEMDELLRFTKKKCFRFFIDRQSELNVRFSLTKAL